MTPPEAAARAFEQHRVRVETVAAAILHDADEAKDVASEAFLALLQHGPSDQAAALPWLLVTARNKALNRIRDRRRALARETRAASEEEAREENPFGEDAAAELVRRALDRLARRDRTAIVLRYLEYQDYGAIAAHLGVSSAQARVVVHRAARRLRRETVLILSEYHGLSGSCANRLAHRLQLHDGCSGCTAVMDEISALASFGLAPLPILVFLRGRWTGFGRLIGAFQPKSEAYVRIAEAVAVFIVAASVAGSGAPGPSFAFGSQNPSRVFASDSPPAADVGLDLASIAGGPGSTDRAGAAVVRSDSVGDTPLAKQEEVRALLPVRLPDALDVHGDRGIDIRAFSIATLTDRKGNPSALRLLFDLAEAPPEGASFSVDWLFESTGCAGSAFVTLWSEHKAAGSGSEGGPAGGYEVTCASSSSGVVTNEQTAVQLPLRATAASTRLEMVLPFQAGSDKFSSMLQPGASLAEIVAQSSLGVLSDRAPDDHAMKYRVAG